MKRILISCAAFLSVTIFFTGCNSIVGSIKVDSSEIKQSVAESCSVSPTVPESPPPDVFEQNMGEKFEDLNAPRAFQIKAEHSQEKDDLESFQIGALLEENTFVYAYSTRVKGEETPRDMVHSAAFYRYDTGELQVFHENRFAREWEESEEMEANDMQDEKEAFFIQVCTSGEKGEEEIFIYDNGEGYLYRRDGTLKLHTDIAGFIHLQYPDVHSVSVIHALTDGDNRIYLELSIEKEAVTVPEEEEEQETDKAQGEEKDEEGTDKSQEDANEAEDTEKEMEALDQEMADKVENLILVYEVRSLQPQLHQENEQFEAHVGAWTALADGQEFAEGDEPDGGADWEEVMEELPDQWSGTDILNMGKMAVYEWKNDPVFLYEGDICTFIPDANAYQPFVNLTEDWEFWKQFIPYQSHYSRLFGRVGSVSYHDEESFTRTFTVVSTVEYQNEEGKTVTDTHRRDVTQTLVLDTRHRYAPLNNAYVESYWIVDKGKATALGNASGKDILCSNEKGEAYWLLPEGKLEKIGDFGEEEQLQVIRDGEYSLLLSYDSHRMKIQTDKRHTPEEAKEIEEDEIVYLNLAGVAKPGESAYDQYFQQKNTEQIAGGFDGYGGIYLNGDQLLRTQLSLDKDVVKELTELGQDVFMPSEQGYLLTIQDKGMIYYDSKEERSMVLLEGSWYRSWKNGGKYVSVGFSGDAFYDKMDIVYSRVYTYDLNELVRSVMKDTRDDLLEQKKKEEELEQSRAEEERTRESVDPEETVEDMLDRWNREYPKEEREKEVLEKLEGLDAPKKEESSEPPESAASE